MLPSVPWRRWEETDPENYPLPMHNSEHPLVYRWRLQQSRRPLWLRHLGLAVHVMLVGVLAYALDSSGYSGEGPWVLFTLVWTLYLCGRPLIEGVHCLASERQRGTFETLLTTDLTPRDWVTSSFWMLVRPRWLELGALVALGSLGGHSERWLSVGLLLFAAIPAYAALGLYLSSRQLQPVRAQLQALSLLVGAFFVSVAIDALLFHQGDPAFCQYTSPWLAAYGLLYDRFANIQYLPAGLAYLALALGFLHRTIAVLSRGSLLRTSRSATRSRSFPGVRHAFLYRALLQGGYSRWTWLQSLAMPLLLIALWMGKAGEFLRVGRDSEMLGLVLVAIYVSIRVAMAGSQTFAGERENRNWESLLATRMSLREIFLYLSQLALFPVLAETVLLGGLWTVLSGHDALAAFYLVVWTLALGGFALYQSCRCSSSAQALSISAGVALVLSFAGFFAFIWHDNSPLAAISPFYVLASLAENRTHNLDVPLSLALYGLAGPLSLVFGYRKLARP